MIRACRSGVVCSLRTSSLLRTCCIRSISVMSSRSRKIGWLFFWWVAFRRARPFSQLAECSSSCWVSCWCLLLRTSTLSTCSMTWDDAVPSACNSAVACRIRSGSVRVDEGTIKGGDTEVGAGFVVSFPFLHAFIITIFIWIYAYYPGWGVKFIS